MLAIDRQHAQGQRDADDQAIAGLPGARHGTRNFTVNVAGDAIVNVNVVVSASGYAVSCRTRTSPPAARHVTSDGR
jgi:hypothetical protein